MQGIDGTVAIVTGASSGIGQATAIRFAEEGAQVVVADVDEEGGRDTVALVEGVGGDAFFVRTDVSDEDDVRAMVEEAVGTFGRLDFAFNNAGIEGETAPLAETETDQWARTIGINLAGVFYGMKHEVPAIVESGGGAVVNTSSVAGLVGFGEYSPYVASKHGVVGLTRTAALEYSGQGVRVNAVCPGVIDTPMIQRTAEENADRLAQVEAAHPIGRIGEPEEVAAATVWLCSDDASFVTGVPLPVDGGYTVQ